MPRLGKYELNEPPLGDGGYGTVYRAMDTVLEVERAVKVLHPALAAEPDFIERFRREARLTARLRHANIVPVYDLDESQGRYFLAMDYLSGGSLKDLLAKEGRLPFERALEITRQAAAGLDYAHRQGLVHRDVKPGNILFDADGTARLSDFGFAKAMLGAGSASLSSSGRMIGTPAYMAPEIWLEQEATPATDVYSLACVVFEMLTGAVLFGGDSPAGLMTCHLMDGPQFPAQWPEGTPAGIDAVLRKALDREPGRRYASLGEMGQALEQLSRLKDEQQGLQQAVAEQARCEAEERAANAGETRRQGQTGPRFLIWGLAIGAAVILLAVTAIRSTWVTSQVGQRAARQTDTAVAAAGEIITPATPVRVDPLISPTPSLFPTQITDGKGVRMALIPAGEFQMGSENGEDHEQPVHKVYVSAFYMDIYEVTNEAFAACVQAGECSPPSRTGSNTRSSYYGDPDFASYPVVMVDWSQASEYCGWRGGRLPSEAEWEKAARGGLEGMRYPWGDENPVCTPGAENGANFGDCSPDDNVEVGSFGANGYGLYDMAGNVYEWVNDWYDSGYYGNSPKDNPQGPASGQNPVLRGGSWYSPVADSLRAANRNLHDPNNRGHDIGFRCAAAAGE